MHYNDPFVTDNNYLELTVYNDDDGLIIFSIRECKFINPRILKKILSKPDKHLGSYFKDRDEWSYLVKIRFGEWSDDIEYIDITKITNQKMNKDESLGLH